MKLQIAVEAETDGRWIAEVDAIPGVLAYGVSRIDAVALVQALALRALAERMEQGEAVPELLNVEFRIGDRRFERPEVEAEGENAAQVTLASLQLTKGARFTYVYDFGDDWEHEITVEEVAPLPDAEGFEWFPRILDGERAGPPEDVGGIMGYGDFLAALKDPKHPEHVVRREWAPTGFDSERFDLAAADHALTLVCAWGAI
jgi:predicted RNase H-like HicB family nuclease